MHYSLRLDRRLITGFLLACAAPTLAAPITVNSFQAQAFCADGPQRQSNNLTALATGTSQVQCRFQVGAPAPVPEPSSLGLLGLCLAGLACTVVARSAGNFFVNSPGNHPRFF